MLLQTELAKYETEARVLIDEAIVEGKALDKFKELIALQKGNPTVCDNTDL
jgi:thymidine phosphorylase